MAPKIGTKIFETAEKEVPVLIRCCYNSCLSDVVTIVAVPQ